MVNEVPVPNDTPPDKPAYQLIIPADADAPMVTVPASHRADGAVDKMVGVGITVAATAVLDELVHPLFVAST